MFASLSGLLAPLAGAITERNATSAHLHADETRWSVFAAIEGKDSHRWWCWVSVSPDTVVFRIAPSRSLAVAVEHLGIDVSSGAPPRPRCSPPWIESGKVLHAHKAFPEAPLDNNPAERAFRRPVVGRKNFYGSGSVCSAELVSATWTIAGTRDHAVAWVKGHLGPGDVVLYENDLSDHYP